MATFDLLMTAGIRIKFQTNERKIMLSYAITFLIIALIAAFLGFFAIAGVAAQIAKVLFVLFLVLFVVSLIFGKRPKV